MYYKLYVHEGNKEYFMVTIRLPSGLKYHVLQPPRKDAPGLHTGEAASIAYTAWLDEAGQPGVHIDMEQLTFVIGAGSVISGVDEGVKTMRVGEKRRFYIPATLAYGEPGTEAVPPESAMIFDIELQKKA
jgi:FKBP-type peptidyl-prolyl cis-trans isomerase